MDRVEPGLPVVPVPLVTKPPPGKGKAKREKKGEDAGEIKEHRPHAGEEAHSENAPTSQPSGDEDKGTQIDIQV